MRTRSTPLVLALVGLCLVLQSCVLSLHSLYSEETIAFKEELLGTWTEKKNSWQFSKAGKNRYLLSLEEGEGEAGKFHAVLVKIGDKHFLDLQPEVPPAEGTPYWKYHLVAAHTFLLVEEIGPKLKMRAMNPEWMKTYLAEHPDAIQATTIDDRPILTAPTQELQKFIAKLAEMKIVDGKEGPFGPLTDLTKTD